MLTKPLVALAFLLVTVVHSAYSNGQYYPGYYVDKNGDSVACSIEYNNWYRNPTSIVVMVNNTRMTLGPNDIRKFVVTGYDEYQSAGVTYHTNPLHGQDLPLEYSDKTVTEAWFLRVLIRGPYRLLELTFADRVYYFISGPDNQVIELVYRAKQVDQNVFWDEQYKSVLSEFMTRENILDQDIAHITYTPASLAFVVNRLNQARTGVQTVVTPTADRRGKSLQMDLFFGGMSDAFPTQYQTMYGAGKLPSTFAVDYGVGLRYIFPRSFGAWSLGLTVGLSSFSSHTTQMGGTQTAIQSPTWYDSTYYTESQRISNTMVLSNLYVLYIFTHQKKINFYGRAGVNVDYILHNGENPANADILSNYTETSYLHAQSAPPQLDYTGQGSLHLIEFAPAGFCWNLSLGIMCGRSRLELTYYTPMGLGLPNEPTFTMQQAGATYFFTVVK